MNNPWVLSTIPLIAGIVLLSCSFIGWGHLVWALTRRRLERLGGDRQSINLFELGVVGTAAVYVVAVVVSLFLALTPLVSDLVVGAVP